MAKARKLDMRTVLAAIDRRDFNWLSQQPEDVRKEFKPFLMVRWMSSLPNSELAAFMLWLVNERVNNHLFDLYQHPDLLFRLMASCGTGRPVWRERLDGRQHRQRGNPAIELLMKYNPHASSREIELLLGLHTRDTFVEFLHDCGTQPDEAKDILKAYDASKRREIPV